MAEHAWSSGLVHNCEVCDCSPALICNMHVTTYRSEIVGHTLANVIDVNPNLTRLITTEHLFTSLMRKPFSLLYFSK